MNSTLTNRTAAADDKRHTFSPIRMDLLDRLSQQADRLSKTTLHRYTAPEDDVQILAA